uniref:Probable U3 small nucleolar RNA-associated protein 11 n=1 Tax=Meloidogyne incognita TaxID=6306 RepID=A0A914MZF5_MELIC
MLKSQVGLDGVHRDMESDDEEQTEVQRLLSDITDINYVKFHLQKEKKKIEKLKSVLHFCAEKEIDEDISGSTSRNVPPVNKHIIFVKNKKQAKTFDLAKHFNTTEQFISQTFNRPKINPDNSVESQKIKLDIDKLEETEKERRSLCSELGKRIERVRELNVVLAKLELKRDLQLSKGSELKPKKVKNGNAEKRQPNQLEKTKNAKPALPLPEQEDREEKARLISQILELQNTLQDLSQRVESVREESLKLSSENIVLGKYIRNLIGSSSLFQPTNSTANTPKEPNE